MEKEDIIRGFFLVKNGEVYTLIFINKGKAEEYDLLDESAILLIENFIDKIKHGLAIFDKKVQ